MQEILMNAFIGENKDYKSTSILCIFSGLAPTANALVHSLRRYPDLHDDVYSKAKFKTEAAEAPLVLP